MIQSEAHRAEARATARPRLFEVGGKPASTGANPPSYKKPKFSGSKTPSSEKSRKTDTQPSLSANRAPRNPEVALKPFKNTWPFDDIFMGEGRT